MKKLILILTLIFALALCFVACDKESKENKSDFLEDISVESEENNLPDAEIENNIGVLLSKENNIDMFSSFYVHFDELRSYGYAAPVENSFESKMQKIKGGDRPLLAVFDPSSYYYVCAYFEVPEGHVEIGTMAYCCVEKYTWVMFEKEDEILEFYNGIPFLLAFQINRAAFVDDVLNDNYKVPQMQYFQEYKPEFMNGINKNKQIYFDEAILYLNHYDKDNIYFTPPVISPECNFFPCVKHDGEYYVSVYIQTINPDGKVYLNDLTANFGFYYDDLMELMLPERQGVKDTNGSIRYYGLISAYDFVLAEKNAFPSSFLIEDKELLADLIVTHPGISSYYKLQVDIINGELYIYDSLYKINDQKQVNIDINLNKYMTSNTLTNDQILNLIKKFNEQKQYYVIERIEDGNVKNVIAVYCVDKIYYFVSFTSTNMSEILFIHCANV